MAGHGEEEFDEGEVWDVLQQDQSESQEAALADPTPPRSRRAGKSKAAVPRVDGEGGAGARGKGRRPSSSSAPVAIPAWCSSRRGGRVEGRDEDGEEEEGGEMLPPHEWLARKMERMNSCGAPAAEIRGRSKGREMRKVRDAVLPKTAFSEHYQ